MKLRKNLQFLVLSASVLCTFLTKPSISHASTVQVAVEEFVNIAVGTSANYAGNGDSLGISTATAVIEEITDKIGSKVFNEIFKDIPIGKRSILYEPFKSDLIKKIKKLKMPEESLFKKGNLRIGAAAFVDAIVGVVIDSSAEIIRDRLMENGTSGSIATGQAAYFAIQQLNVAYAAKRGGLIGAVIAESMLATGQIAEAIKLHKDLVAINESNAAKEKLSEASSYLLQARKDYFTSDPKLKFLAEITIRAKILGILHIDGKPMAGAETAVNLMLKNMKRADAQKYEVLEELLLELSAATPENAKALRDKVIVFAKGKFHDSGKPDSSNEFASVLIRIENVFSSIRLIPIPNSPLPCQLSDCSSPIVVSVDPVSPSSDLQYRGFLSGTAGTGSLFWTDATVGPDGTTPIRSGSNQLFSSVVSPSATVFLTDASYETLGSTGGWGTDKDFQYTSWGDWDGNGATISFYDSPIDQGQWVAGRLTKQSEYALRTGKATFKGDMRGIDFAGDTATGFIQLDANFDRPSISGAFALVNVANQWVGGTIPTVAIVQNANGVSFNGYLNVGHEAEPYEGNISGVFMGPNATEMAGAWNVTGVDILGGGGADGVFRAIED